MIRDRSRHAGFLVWALVAAAMFIAGATLVALTIAFRDVSDARARADAFRTAADACTQAADSVLARARSDAALLAARQLPPAGEPTEAQTAPLPFAPAELDSLSQSLTADLLAYNQRRAAAISSLERLLAAADNVAEASDDAAEAIKSFQSAVRRMLGIHNLASGLAVRDFFRSGSPDDARRALSGVEIPRSLNALLLEAADLDTVRLLAVDAPEDALLDLCGNRAAPTLVRIAELIDAQPLLATGLEESLRDMRNALLGSASTPGLFQRQALHHKAERALAADNASLAEAITGLAQRRDLVLNQSSLFARSAAEQASDATHHAWSIALGFVAVGAVLVLYLGARTASSASHHVREALQAHARAQQHAADLSKVNERFAMAVRGGNLGVWDWNPLTGSLVWDDTLYALYGSDPSASPPGIERWLTALHPDDRDSAAAHFQKALDAPASLTFSGEFRTRRPDGSVRWVHAHAFIRRDSTGKPIRLVGINQDITERRLAEEQLRITARDLDAALARAEQASRAKSAFLANMSHEIRTPLTSILGFADLLLDPALPERDRRDALLTMRRNGDHLLALVSDILDLSKIEADRLTLESLSASPVDLLRSAVSLLRPRADAKGLYLRLSFTPPLPSSITTDPTRLRQVLLNLLSNAVKFTDAGGVDISLDMPAPRTLRFSIRDTGIGMSPDQSANIFSPFTQADESTTRRFGGTGLGLAISRRLVTLLGGSISVTSTPGRGSTFSFTITADPVPGSPMLLAFDPDPAKVAAQPVPLNAALHGTAILLAEDGPDTQRLLSHHLRRAGARVDIASNGREAVRLARAASLARKPYHVILMDMQMPVLDGYRATARLRAAGYTAPILALTAHAMVGDREKCLAAGCDRYLTKPIDRDTLIAEVARHALRVQPVPPRAAA